MAWWRRVVELLERSGLERCDLGPPDELSTLERDAGGLLSRLRLGRTDSRTAELLARALTRVTAIESAAAVPPKLARLVTVG